MIRPPQDAGRPSTPTARADSTPLSTGDLYGTRAGRLHDLSRKCDRLATRCEAMGCPQLAGHYRERALSYAQDLAAIVVAETPYGGVKPNQIRIYNKLGVNAGKGKKGGQCPSRSTSNGDRP